MSTDEQIIVGAGATGVVMQVLQALTRPGDRIVMATPTFDGYPIFAQMARLQTVTVPLDERDTTTSTPWPTPPPTRKSWWCAGRTTPPARWNRPTTSSASCSGLVRGTVVLLDEAYIEFVSPSHRIHPEFLLRRFPNVVVVRTFSKAYGLAGIRTGYGICSPAMGRTLWSMQLPFGATVASLAAVAASFEAEAQLRHRIGLITAERDHLRSRLREMGVWSADTHANFVYLPRRDNFGPRRSTAPARGCALSRRRRADHRRKSAVHTGGAGDDRRELPSDAHDTHAERTIESTIPARAQDRRVVRRRGLLSATSQERQGISRCPSRVSAMCCSRRNPPTSASF